MRDLTRRSARPISVGLDLALIHFAEFMAVLPDRLSPPRLTDAFVSERQRTGLGLHDNL